MTFDASPFCGCVCVCISCHPTDICLSYKCPPPSIDMGEFNCSEVKRFHFLYSVVAAIFCAAAVVVVNEQNVHNS